MPGVKERWWPVARRPGFQSDVSPYVAGSLRFPPMKDPGIHLAGVQQLWTGCLATGGTNSPLSFIAGDSPFTLNDSVVP